MVRRKVQPRSINSVADVIIPLRNKYNDSLLNKALHIFTPFSGKKSLPTLSGLTPEAKEFIFKYEPRAITDGLFSHQYELLDAYNRGAEHFILTSSTGSGKSLCFWTWIMDVLARDRSATALVCFPTQALIWGQAERLARISEHDSLKIYDQKKKIAYSGKIRLNGQAIGWTVWKGVGSGETQDFYMRQHEKSWDFVSARIRIATLDKAHYSLIKDNPEFTVNLKCMVLDEAHQYDGIFGANVASFLKRVYVAKTSAGRSKPNMFLASATLADAKSFASKLLSIPEKDIYHQKDTNQSIIEPVKINDVQQILNEPTPNGLTRVVLFNDGMVNNSHIAQVVSDTSIIGEKLNLLYFLDSKFLSRVKKSEIEKKTPQRKVVIYDGDLTPQKRRQIESYFNGQQLTGATLIATSALEMGVDIENLDVCILHSLPPKRADILQRIGRVGRRQERPGLILVNLAKSPLDRYISETVDAIFRAENAMSVPIPANIEIINLKNIAAVQYEMWKNGSWCHGRYHGADWPTYKQSLRQYFGVDLNISEVKKKIKERYSSLIELNTGENWTHKGFRASVSGSKIPIKIYDTKDEIAWIDSINIFRDAHPEAVYLDDQDRCWRVVAYSGKWKEALWDHPESDAILAKYLKSIDVVYVKPERSNIVTRGIWEEKFKPYQILNEPPQATTFPKQGNFEYGIWEYYRRFNGYMQINRSTKSQTKVDLAEVSERFKSAINNGGEFPFLFPLTYRTYGWEWSFPDALQNYSPALLNSINSLVGAIIIPFIADAIQTKPNDLIIYLSLPTKKLMVLDATPGGNGLSEGLLRCQGIPAAFQKCLAMLIQFTGGNNREKFRDYIINFCQEDATHDAEDLIKIIHEIKNHWGG